MAKNITALKNLYKQLGGDPEDVQDCSTITEVLNAISGKYDGETDAATNPDAIDNIAAVAENIGGGGGGGSILNASLTINNSQDSYQKANIEYMGFFNGNLARLMDNVTISGHKTLRVCNQDYIRIYSPTPSYHVELTDSENVTYYSAQSSLFVYLGVGAQGSVTVRVGN